MKQIYVILFVCVACIGCGELSWQIVRQAQPDVFISSEIVLFSNSNNQKIEFATESIGGGSVKISYQCQLDFQEWASCDSPVIYSSLLEGEHVFSVLAQDNQGQVVGEARAQWTVDLTPPAVTIRSKSGQFAIAGS